MNTTQLTLKLIDRRWGACPTTFLNAGVGVRYSARIHELRQQGYQIVTLRSCEIPGHSHPRRTVSYKLVGRP